MKKVYLAGPITGCSWDETENWRDQFKSFHIPRVECFSPLRGKGYLKGETSIKDHYDQVESRTMSSAKAIMTRDSFDVRTADALVVNFTGAKKVSIGTVMEIAWAWQNRTPVIAIGMDHLHDHSMLNEAINWKVDTLEDAAEILRMMFNP